MACCLYSAKPLPEAMLTCWQFDPLEQKKNQFEWQYDFFFQEHAF